MNSLTPPPHSQQSPINGRCPAINDVRICIATCGRLSRSSSRYRLYDFQITFNSPESARLCIIFVFGCEILFDFLFQAFVPTHFPDLSVSRLASETSLLHIIIRSAHYLGHGLGVVLIERCVVRRRNLVLGKSYLVSCTIAVLRSVHRRNGTQS